MIFGVFLRHKNTSRQAPPRYVMINRLLGNC
jgi:hypothetical protein